jgi:hypothetical protein
MSLINDALKQARQTQDTNPAKGPSLEHVNAPRPRRGADSLLLPLLIITIILLAVVMLFQWFRGTAVTPVRARMLETPVAAAKLPDASRLVIVPAPVKPSETSAVTNAPAMPLVTAPPKPLPPIYKLGGIFYEPSNPTAVINGRSVSIGSRILDARVTAITPNSATLLTAAGETKVLKLPED